MQPSMGVVDPAIYFQGLPITEYPYRDLLMDPGLTTKPHVKWGGLISSYNCLRIYLYHEPCNFIPNDLQTAFCGVLSSVSTENRFRPANMWVHHCYNGIVGVLYSGSIETSTRGCFDNKKRRDAAVSATREVQNGNRASVLIVFNLSAFQTAARLPHY